MLDFFLDPRFIGGFLAAGSVAVVTLVMKGWRAPTKEDFETFKKDVSDKLDGAIARIEERTFDMAFKLGQQDQRTKHLDK